MKPTLGVLLVSLCCRLSRVVVLCNVRTQVRAAPVQMSLFDGVSAEALSSAQDVATSVILATKETDFGGYVGPAAGLLTLGALIVVLAPPLSSSEE